jgi:cytochrome c-L
MLGFKSIKAAILISMLGFFGLTVATQASATCNLVSTKDSTPLAVKAVDTDTPEAKSFLETCINPYTKAYAADPTLIKAGGKKLFGYNGCSGCHGGKLEGVMAPALNKQGGQG